ncbi:MAG TPA: hypothetical protein VK203_27500 [Nostocaceae cyanobacterium]|nr:hypothetical protein [Nostocaceae cyanobacterium]
MNNYTLIDKSIIDNINSLEEGELLELMHAAIFAEESQGQFSSVEEFRAAADCSVLISNATLDFLRRGSQANRFCLIQGAMMLIKPLGSLPSLRYQFTEEQRVVKFLELGYYHTQNTENTEVPDVAPETQEQTNKAEMPLLHPELPHVDPILYDLKVDQLLQLGEAAFYAEREGIGNVEELRAALDLDNGIPSELTEYVAEGSRQNRLSIIWEITQAITHKEPGVGGVGLEFKHFTNTFFLQPTTDALKVEPDMLTEMEQTATEVPDNDAYDLVYEQGEEM